MANTLNLGNGNWATKEDSLLAYNSENGNYKPLPFDFTRASSATVVNKAGLIETVGSGEPRIDFLGNTKGALKLEPQRSNLITYSSDFSNAAWVKLGAGTGSAAIVTSDYAISPDGTQNATRLQCDLNGGLTSSANQSLIYDSYTSSGNQSISIYVKSNTGSNQTIYFANTQTSGDTITVTSDWQRFEFSHSTATYIVAIGLRGRSGGSIDDTADILIWGAQTEQGSYATSYIPTSGSEVTRSIDTCIQTVPEGIVNENEMTLYCELEYIGGANIIAMSVHNNSNSVIWLNIEADLTVTGVNFYGGFYGASRSTTSLELNNKYKIAYRTKNGDSALYINGILEASSTETIANPNILNKVQLGGFWTSANTEGNFKIIDAKCYNSGLSNSELAALTS